MSVSEKPAFEFTAENLEKAKAYIARYPEGRQHSSVLMLLDLAQRQNGGFLPVGAIDAVRGMLKMPPIRVMEEIGRAHVCTPVTYAHLVCRLLPATKKNQ